MSNQQQQQQSQFLMGRTSQSCYGNSGGWSSPSQNNWSPGPPGSGWGHRGGPMNSGGGGRGSGMGGPGPAAMAAATAAAMAQRNKLFGSSSNAGFPQGGHGQQQQYVQNRMKKPPNYSGMKPSMDIMGNYDMHQVKRHGDCNCDVIGCNCDVIAKSK